MINKNLISGQISKYYTLKIELDKIKPEIWRSFRVPSNIPLDYLHDVIQIVMNWLDYHLHEFEINGKIYTEMFDDHEYDRGEKDESGISLSKYIKKVGQTFTYTYDFGDNWIHNLTLTKIENTIPDRHYEIECLDGERTTPPEDVGSINGYYDFCDIMNNKSHPEYKEYKIWYEGFEYNNIKFNRDAFNISRVNKDLASYIRYSRLRSKYWYI